MAWLAVLLAAACGDPALAPQSNSPADGVRRVRSRAADSGSEESPASAVGPRGGSVELLRFAVSGDARPPWCNDLADYPGAVVSAIASAERDRGAQFVVDLGDHMFACDGDASSASAQMQVFTQSAQQFGGTWFFTLGNHDCANAPCSTSTADPNFAPFMAALAPISSQPYYMVPVATRPGLVLLVVVADDAWDAAQASWLEQTLAGADAIARDVIIAKHHPQGDQTCAANAAIMDIIRRHRFTLLLTGHAHHYAHETADDGRDLILGNGGAPLDAPGSWTGFAMVDELESGELRVTAIDLASGATRDTWSVSPR